MLPQFGGGGKGGVWDLFGTRFTQLRAQQKPLNVGPARCGHAQHPHHDVERQRPAEVSATDRAPRRLTGQPFRRRERPQLPGSPRRCNVAASASRLICSVRSTSSAVWLYEMWLRPMFSGISSTPWRTSSLR